MHRHLDAAARLQHARQGGIRVFSADECQHAFAACASPGPDVTVRLAEINKAIECDMALFFGTKEKTTWTITFRLKPKEACQRLDLFAWNEHDGVTEFQLDAAEQDRVRLLQEGKEGV